MELDQLDLALLTTLREHPRTGPLELSRLVKVARATVQARLQRMEAAGVITGYGPDLDLEAAGCPLAAFVTLEIAQGALDEVAAELTAMPTILEAFMTTGSADVLCKVAAVDHADLQETLLELNRSSAVVRSTSVVVLGTVVAPRVLPLLERSAASRASRAPAHR